jgi:glycosyltransferase involved in cell wall biosynthesis
MPNKDVFADSKNFQSEKVNPQSTQSADLIIGIPSYKEADNIAFVSQICDEGLLKYFPNYKSVIINVDNNSPDDTKSEFLNAKTQVPKIYISTPPGVQGKGNNFFNLFCEAQKLKAKGIVVVDADLRSITPEWIRDLALPILDKGYDFATPLYSRNEYDGTITNMICYPLLYGLLGKDIRQPIGGEFSFSNKYVDYVLNQPWHETTRQYGIDIFMTLNAILGDFKTCKVGLGAKIHKPSAPKLGPMFTQVVDTLFKTVLSNQSQWESVKGIEELPVFGKVEFAQPQTLSVDYKEMKTTAQCGFNISQDILFSALETSVYEKIAQMYKKGKINISVSLWSQIVYDCLHAYSLNGKDLHLIEALKPLYFGRVISFIRQTLDMDYISSEKEIQRQAKYFHKNRNRLIRKFSKREVA